MLCERRVTSHSFKRSRLRRESITSSPFNNSFSNIIFLYRMQSFLHYRKLLRPLRIRLSEGDAQKTIMVLGNGRYATHSLRIVTWRAFITYFFSCRFAYSRLSLSLSLSIRRGNNLRETQCIRMSVCIVFIRLVQYQHFLSFLWHNRSMILSCLAKCCAISARRSASLTSKSTRWCLVRVVQECLLLVFCILCFVLFFSVHLK